MVDTHGTLTPPASYRIEGVRGLFIWAFLGFLGAFSMASGFAGLGFLLTPLVFLLVRANVYRFLVLLVATYTCFFLPGPEGTTVKMLFTGDVITISFILLLILSYLQEPKSLRPPLSPTLISLYLAVAYITLLAARSIPSERRNIDQLLFDIKNAWYLLLIPLLLIVDGRGREPKKFFLLLGAFVSFCSVHSLIVIGTFLATQERVLTWNEIFISDAVIISALLMRFKLGAKTLWLLWFALATSIVALLLTQTRGLWISTVVSLGVFYVGDLFRGKKLRPAYLFKTALIAGGGFILANVLFLILSGQTVVRFIATRMKTDTVVGLIDPFSSMGYRIHESWVVWDQRTIFGYGPGANLYLYFTQFKMPKFMEWWSIHSGYFEFLHKYGFVGMAIILWMFGCYFFLGWRLAGSRSKAVSGFGAIIATVILNHAIVSITSAYFFKHAVIVWVLLFLIAERLRVAKPRLTS